MTNLIHSLEKMTQLWFIKSYSKLVLSRSAKLYKAQSSADIWFVFCAKVEASHY